MLVSLRKNLAKNIFRFLLFLTFISMIVSYGVIALFKKGSGAQRSVVAHINGSHIDYRDFQYRAEAKQGQLMLMRYQLEKMGIPFDPQMFAFNPLQLALSTLVEEQLLSGLSSSLRISLPEEYIGLKLVDPYFMTQKITDFFPYYFTVSEEINSEVLARLLRSKGMNIADFESYIERDLERQIVKNSAQSASYVPSFMVRSHYVKEHAPKKFSVIKLAYDTFLQQEKKKPISSEELKNFFEEHNKKEGRYVIPEKRSGVVWEFAPQKYGIKVSDQALRTYYDEHKRTFMAHPTQVKVRRIVLKIQDPSHAQEVMTQAQAIYDELKKAPELFAQKAATLSHDTTTAQKGGVVDFFARGDKDAAFEKVAFGLKADGDISPPFQTSDGIEIIQRVERKAPAYKPFEAVRAEVHDIVLAREFKAAFEKDIERLKHESTPEAPGAFAAAKQAKKTTVEEVAQGSTLEDRLFKIKQPHEFAFYHDGSGSFLIQLTKIVPSYTPQLAAVKDRVTADMYKDRADKAVLVAMNEAKKKVRTTPFTDLAKAYAATVEPIAWLKADEKERIEKLAAQGLPVSSLLGLEKVGATITYYDGTNAYLARLDDVGAVNEADFKAQETEVAALLKQNDAHTLVNGFIASLTRNATIEIHKEALSANQSE